MRSDRIWIIVLVSGFLGLMVDGMDLMFLSYSLPSLMRDFHIDKIRAGSLASYTLLGMAIGGIAGGWAADRYGRVRVVVWTIALFSVGTAGLAFKSCCTVGVPASKFWIAGSVASRLCTTALVVRRLCTAGLVASRFSTAGLVASRFCTCGLLASSA